LCRCGRFNGPGSRDCSTDCNNNLPEAQGYLLFESSSGENCDYISAEKFANCIEKLDSKIKDSLFILITACKSSSSYRNDYVFGGIAQKLMSKGIPATIAMQYPISIKSSKEFVGEFYKCLAEKKTLVQSLYEARKAVEDGKYKSSPVLYLNIKRNPNGNIFKISRANRKNQPSLYGHSRGYDFYIKKFRQASKTYLQFCEIYSDAKYLRNFINSCNEQFLENNNSIQRHCKEMLNKIKDTAGELEVENFDGWSKSILDDIIKLPEYSRYDYMFKEQNKGLYLENLNRLKQQCESATVLSATVTHQIAVDITAYCWTLQSLWKEIQAVLSDIAVDIVKTNKCSYEFYIQKFAQASKTYLKCYEIYTNAKYLKDFLLLYVTRELSEEPEIQTNCKQIVNKIKDTSGELEVKKFHEWSQSILENISKLPENFPDDYRIFQQQSQSVNIKNYQNNLSKLKQQCKSVMVPFATVTYEIALDISEYGNELKSFWEEIREALLTIAVDIGKLG